MSWGPGASVYDGREPVPRETEFDTGSMPGR